MKKHSFSLTMAALLALGLALGGCDSPAGPVTAPGAPAKPAVTAGDAKLDVSWAAVPDAASYEVWYGTTANSSGATQSGGDVTGTTATITGLANGTEYYVWIRAKNGAGTGDFSPSATGKPVAGGGGIIDYTVTANGGDGTVSTTTLTLAFDSALGDLKAGEINVAEDAGKVTKGNLADSADGGKTWVLGVTTNRAGTVTVTVTKAGVAPGGKSVTVHKAGEEDPFVAVTGITGLPQTATAGVALALQGTVEPANATNRAITWSLKDAGGTGAEVDANTFTATEPGTATVTATVANGATAATPYTQDFDITVSPATGTGKILSSIALKKGPAKTVYTVGESLDLSGMVVTVTWNDESTEDIADTAKFATAGFDSRSAAESRSVTVKFTAGGVTKETQFTVEIKAAATTPPAAPGAPAVTAGDAKLDVTWATVARATAYEVWYGTASDGAGRQQSGGDVTGTAATISGLANGTQYYVWIRAKNNVDSSDFSPPAAGKPAAGGGVTIDFTVTADGKAGTTDTSALTLAFGSAVGDLKAGEITVAEDAGKVTKGSLADSADGGRTWVLSVTTAKAGAVTVTVTKAGVVSGGKSVTVHKAGEEDPFVAVTGITGLTQTATVNVPLTLQGTVEPSNATNRTITWSVKDAGTTGAAITAGTFTAQAAGTATVTATVVNGATATTPYTQDFSITVSPAPTAPPAAPGAPTVTPGDAKLDVSWSAVTGATAYEVWCGTASDGTGRLQSGNDVTGTSATITGLENGRQYYVWIRAKNNVDSSAFSPSAAGTPSAQAGITVNFNGSVAVTDGNGNAVGGALVLSRSGAGGKPASAVLHAPGYTGIKWRVDGEILGEEASCELKAADLSLRTHSVVFEGWLNGAYLSSDPVLVTVGN